MPNLTHLGLDSCEVHAPSPFFPNSFPSFSAERVEISVTDITLRNVRQYIPSDDAIFHASIGGRLLCKSLPRLTAVTIERYTRLHVVVLQQLTTLALLGMRPESAITVLNEYLDLSLLFYGVENQAREEPGRPI
jgi:hypothetical protein